MQVNVQAQSMLVLVKQSHLLNLQKKFWGKVKISTESKVTLRRSADNLSADFLLSTKYETSKDVL